MLIIDNIIIVTQCGPESKKTLVSVGVTLAMTF